MKKLKIALTVPLALIAASTFAQGDNHAVPRSSGGSSHSSDSGSRHSGGGASSSSSGGSGGSSSSDGGSSASSGGRYDSAVPDAARRRPRPGTGSGDRDRYGNHYRSYPYSSYYYNPYVYSYGYGLPYGYYGYGYGYNDYGFSYGDYYGYYPNSYSRGYRYRSGNIAQLRTLVEPSKARVYVDGYYAGVVDDFDGLLQRLNVSPGRHDISFRLEGYKSHTFTVYANRDQTLKLRWDLQKGEGETSDQIGEDNGNYGIDEQDRDMDRERDPRDREPVYDRDAQRRDPSREVDEADGRYDPPSRDGERGQVAFEVEPGDASVYVDGEFYGKATQVTHLDLPAGRHRVEVVRPGYKTEETEVEVGRDGKRVVIKLERR